ncbi:MAG: hypothetical protein ACR2G5_18510 [Pyrinomonadaceae bacterium]
MPAVTLVSLVLLISLAAVGSAQKKIEGGGGSGHETKSTPGKVNETRDTANNTDYTNKIKEYTTEPYFMTELVDHLPMSDKVPSPDKVLGYIVGTPNRLTYTKDIYRYFSELAYRSISTRRRCSKWSPKPAAVVAEPVAVLVGRELEVELPGEEV